MLKTNILLVLLCLSSLHQVHAQKHATIPAGLPVWQPDSIYPYSMTLLTIDSVSYTAAQVMPKLDKPVVLSFWLTTCYPCRMELEAYSKLYTLWKTQINYEIVAVSIDFPQRFQQIGKIARDAAYPFPVYWDVNREFSQIMPGGLNGLPQVFIIGKDGKIAYHKQRYVPGDEVALFEMLKKLQ